MKQLLAPLTVATVTFELLTMAAFYTGITPVLGWETGYARTHGMGSLFSIAGVLSWHIPLGSKIFYARAGQEVFVNYDKAATAGSLWMSTRPLFSLMETTAYTYADTKPQGTITLKIPASGLYYLDITPTVLGGPKSTRGYDLSWTLTWGVR